jgi:16S rRNA (guanine966-N2)-methyltransferase|tara:strand:- start:58 stop:615 length:558 start_codon:yes stop_codon:yes gene_type:complete
MKNTIRISSGTLRGKKIPFDFKDSLRPTSNKLKEILFNWIQFDINDSICLDLFSGTGSIGIEAVSRSAEKVIFVELNKKNYSRLVKNISTLNIKEKTKIFFKDAYLWVKNNDLSKFDFIFLDPPFNEDHELKILNLIQKKDLKSSCKIYLEYSKFTELDIPESLSLLKEKSVGDVKALLLSKNED